MIVKKLFLSLFCMLVTASLFCASGQGGGAVTGALVNGYRASEKQTKKVTSQITATAAKAATESTAKNISTAGIGIPMGSTKQKENPASAATKAIRNLQKLTELNRSMEKRLDSLVIVRPSHEKTPGDSMPTLLSPAIDSLLRQIEGTPAPSDTTSARSGQPGRVE